MGVDVCNLPDRDRSIHASWWQWRPTVELLRSLGLFDNERLDALSDGYGEFDEEETNCIAAALEQHILPRFKPGERVLLDGSATEVPDDGTFHREPEHQHLNYSADYDWLVDFLEFCKKSKGLYIC